jgi:hypothetical protein
MDDERERERERESRRKKGERKDVIGTKGERQRRRKLLNYQ